MLPADLQAPYSLLELCASKYLGYWHIIKEIYTEKDPLLRFITVLRWLLAVIKEHELMRKPYNSDLNEIHTAVFNGATFYAQQVSHHPPISAFAVVDKNLQLQANCGSDVRFHGNSVTAESNGFLELTVGEQELYKISKPFPSLFLDYVIWGTRIMTWIDELTIDCDHTGYTAKLTFSRDSNDPNIIKGVILQKQQQNETVLYTFEGVLGQDLILEPNSEELSEVKLPLVDLHKDKELIYPNKNDPMETLNIWKEMTYYLVKEDLVKADEANCKRRAAAHQRDKMASPEFDRQLFKWDNSTSHYILNHP
jgi:hypothetical protein